ncbi:hypothetical protein HYPSUDRAFT_105426, partial [Hypholoma sublateritium FD-334 SS-4]
CIFWRETLAAIEKKGYNAVSCIRGKFSDFEKTQLGYYGEIGSTTIHQILNNMFPSNHVDLALILPLTWHDFMQRILAPEVALHLIMEDRGLIGEDGAKVALVVMRESSTYGVAMFPDD